MNRFALAGVLVLGLAGPLSAQEDAGALANRIVVEATGFRNDRGHLQCSLHDQADAFPTHPERAVASARVTISHGRATCSFEGIAPGTYAVALHHDEDDDGQFDTGMFGIPTEGTGASRDARGSMGPPSFRDAQFAFTGGVLRLRAAMTYVF